MTDEAVILGSRSDVVDEDYQQGERV